MSESAFGVEGVRVGHWTDPQAETGCTVVELPVGTVASYEARGGAPASRELELLNPEKTVGAVDAVLLTGGSAFGLAAADGVMAHYESLGRGVMTGAGPVPIVPTMGIFDLAVGDRSVRPGRVEGLAAAQATVGEQVLSGRVGAGAGAYVGHWRGEDRRPAGLNHAVRRHGDLVVGCLVVVNAFGDIGQDAPPELLDTLQLIDGLTRELTTIGVVVTNGRFDKLGCRLLAQGAHDGLARAITPPHSRFDGDGFVAAATGDVDAHVDTARLLAVLAVSDAITSLG